MSVNFCKIQMAYRPTLLEFLQGNSDVLDYLIMQMCCPCEIRVANNHRNGDATRAPTVLAQQYRIRHLTLSILLRIHAPTHNILRTVKC